MLTDVAPFPRASRSPLAACLLLATLGVIAHGLFSRENGPRMEQASSNVRFAERPSLKRALDHYPRLWPPLYPLLLRAWMRSGLAGLRFNELLFLATLPLLWLACRAVAPDVHPFPATLFWAVAHFNHADFYQLTADAAVATLMLALFLLLLTYWQRPSGAHLLALLLANAALLGCRYFSLFAVAPVVLGAIASVPGLAWRRRALHAVGFLFSLLPLGLWMGSAWLRTGFVTGADRTATRKFPVYLRYWDQLQTPSGTLYAWSKTLFLDMFSTRRHGALAIVTTQYQVDPLEWLLLGLALLSAALGIVAALRAPLNSATRLALVLFAAHNVMLLVLWSLGNNDPLHSRYLWPSYSMLLLIGLSAYARTRARWPDAPWAKLPFQVLALLLLVVHLQRSIAATPVPVGFNLEPEAETLDP